MKDYKDYYTPKIYIPKPDKSKIVDRAGILGLSVSSYIYTLIEQDIGNMEPKRETGTQGKGRRPKPTL